jgi:hypothetical protein
MKALLMTRILDTAAEAGEDEPTIGREISTRKRANRLTPTVWSYPPYKVRNSL